MERVGVGRRTHSACASMGARLFRALAYPARPAFVQENKRVAVTGLLGQPPGMNLGASVGVDVNVGGRVRVCVRVCVHKCARGGAREGARLHAQ